MGKQAIRKSINASAVIGENGTMWISEIDGLPENITSQLKSGEEYATDENDSFYMLNACLPACQKSGGESVPVLFASLSWDPERNQYAVVKENGLHEDFSAYAGETLSIQLNVCCYYCNGLDYMDYYMTNYRDKSVDCTTAAAPYRFRRRLSATMPALSPAKSTFSPQTRQRFLLRISASVISAERLAGRDEKRDAGRIMQRGGFPNAYPSPVKGRNLPKRSCFLIDLTVFYAIVKEGGIPIRKIKEKR